MQSPRDQQRSALAGDDWSSQDESEESEDGMEAKEINIKLTGQPKKHKKGSEVEKEV